MTADLSAGKRGFFGEVAVDWFDPEGTVGDRRCVFASVGLRPISTSKQVNHVGDSAAWAMSWP